MINFYDCNDQLIMEQDFDGCVNYAPVGVREKNVSVPFKSIYG